MSCAGDELKMLFGNSETSHKVLCLQERDDGAYAKSVSEFASAEFKDNLVLSNSTPAQHDDQKIGDSEIQKENEVGKSNTSETSAKFLEGNILNIRSFPNDYRVEMLLRNVF